MDSAPETERLFARGPHPAGVTTLQAPDATRACTFSIEVWYPATAAHAGQDLAVDTQDEFVDIVRGTRRRQAAVRDATELPGDHPLVLFSHGGGNDRRQSTALCSHLASHGYVVASLDHWERFGSARPRRGPETPEQRRERRDAVIGSRVPDVCFLHDQLVGGLWASASPARVDPERVGIIGHSFGGWTVLAALDHLPGISALVALAPDGSSIPSAASWPLELAFKWGRDVPVLFLVGEDDTTLPLPGMHELFQRTPSRGGKRMVVLRKAGHMHFMDDAEDLHELVRTMPGPQETQHIRDGMLPVGQTCPGETAAAFVNGLALCHLDAVLGGSESARRFWEGDVGAKLRARGLDAYPVEP